MLLTCYCPVIILLLIIYIYSVLRAGDGANKLRYEVYACTAADRGYALEAWRILDSNAQLIPVMEVPHRLVSVG